MCKTRIFCQLNFLRKALKKKAAIQMNRNFFYKMLLLLYLSAVLSLLKDYQKKKSAIVLADFSFLLARAHMRKQ